MSQHSSKGKEWERIRRAVLDRDNHLCQYHLARGESVQATHVDHILAKSLGGNDSMDNLCASCRDCNLRKGNKYIVRQTWLNPTYFKAGMPA